MGEMEMMWTQHVHCSNRGKRRPFMPPPEPLARAFKLFLGPSLRLRPQEDEP